jgi:hypothetical protein
MKIRTAVASTVSFLMLMSMMSFLANQGYNKVAPRLEEQKLQSEQNMKKIKQLVQNNLADMGTPVLYSEESVDDFLQKNFPGFDPDYHPRRPTGTWMGVRKGDDNKFAIIKFDGDEYWLITKDIVLGDQTEKGNYEYGYISLEFYPDKGTPYSMDYHMLSHNAIQLYGNDCSYNFERADELDLDF